MIKQLGGAADGERETNRERERHDGMMRRERGANEGAKVEEK